MQSKNRMNQFNHLGQKTWSLKLFFETFLKTILPNKPLNYPSPSNKNATWRTMWPYTHHKIKSKEQYAKKNDGYNKWTANATNKNKNVNTKEEWVWCQSCGKWMLQTFTNHWSGTHDAWAEKEKARLQKICDKKIKNIKWRSWGGDPETIETKNNIKSKLYSKNYFSPFSRSKN